MSNDRTSLLRKSSAISAIFGVVFFTTPTGASVSLDDWAPVSDSELADKRGAYITASGLEIEFGARFYTVMDGTLREDVLADVAQRVETMQQGLDENPAIGGGAKSDPVPDTSALAALQEVAPELVVLQEAMPDVIPQSATDSPAMDAATEIAQALTEVGDIARNDVPSAALPGNRVAALQGPTPVSSASAMTPVSGPSSSSAPLAGSPLSAHPTNVTPGPAVPVAASSERGQDPVLPPTPEAQLSTRVVFESYFELSENSEPQQAELDTGTTRIVHQASADGVSAVAINRANNIAIRQFLEVQVQVRNFHAVHQNATRLAAMSAARLVRQAQLQSIR